MFKFIHPHYETLKGGAMKDYHGIVPEEEKVEFKTPKGGFPNEEIAQGWLLIQENHRGHNDCRAKTLIGVAKLKLRLPDLIWDEIQIVLDKDTQLTAESAEEIEQILLKGNIVEKIATKIAKEI